MSRFESLLCGIGVGFLVAALVLKLADLSWLIVSLGVVLLMVSGTGILGKRRPPDLGGHQESHAR